MKKSTLKKHHKWFGLLLCFFMLMFCWSGIVLNHRKALSAISISRTWLPGRYHFSAWNGGLLRGTLRCTAPYAAHPVLVYGAAGIWRTDSVASAFHDFNGGLPLGADLRNIRGLVQTTDGSLFALSPFALYRHNGTTWSEVPLPLHKDELLSDIMARGDSLIVIGRSHLYLSTSPHIGFRRLQLKAPCGHKPRISLFRTFWMLHSGAIFGLPGKLLVDAAAVVLILLCLTGVAYWWLPKHIRRMRNKGKPTKPGYRLLKHSLLCHDRLGRYTFLLLFFIAITGWCLRPPLLIPLAANTTPPLPATTLDSPNPWNDKLRMLRYDAYMGDWLLYTSDGFYALSSLLARPVKIDPAPPAGVMGLNAWQKDEQGNWLVGSFSGMYVWDRRQGHIRDYFTGEPPKARQGPPVGKVVVSGYSADFSGKPGVVEYYKGTDALAQPEALSTLPMSLWSVALEVHTGRMFMGQAATLLYIFLVGGGCLWCLRTGYSARKKKNKPTA